MKRLDAVVKGRVQGVGFRAFVAEQARRLGLRGWVKNQFDGTVRVQAQGEDQPLEALLQALRKGPSLSRVDGVEVAWQDPLESPAQQFPEPPPRFEIR